MLSSLTLRAGLVSLLLFGAFVAAWHIATAGSGPAVKMDPEYAKLFAGWDVPAWERCELVLDGAFDEVWSFLEASYELPAEPQHVRAALAGRVSGPTIRCRAVSWLATATKP